MGYSGGGPEGVRGNAPHADGRWLDRATRFPGWTFAWAITLSATVLIFSTPLYWILDKNSWIERAIQWKINHPLGAIDGDSFCPSEMRERQSGWIAHLSKRTYRVTVPLVAHVVGLNVYGLVAAQNVASVLFLAGCIRLAGRMTGDRVAAVSVGAVHAFAFIGTWGFNDLIYHDMFAYLLLLVCLMSLPAPLYAAAVVLAGFVDERAVLAVPLVMVFWTSGGRSGPDDPARGRRITPVVLSLVTGVGLYAALRMIMTWCLALPPADSRGFSPEVPLHNLSLSPVSVPLLWEFGWLVVISGLATAAPTRPAATLALLAAWIPPLAAAYFVVDFSRSAAYSFPAFWVCLRWLADAAPPARVRALCAAAAAGNLVCPTVQTMGEIWPFTPLFLR